MIPKIIHYCWFNIDDKEYPELVKKCIESWKKYLPDYKIIEWNQNNFDINISLFAKEAYEKKKYAFVADYIRLYVLYNYGGIYLDTDVKVLKSFNDLLNNKAFVCFEGDDAVASSTIGAEKNNYLIKCLLKYYDSRHFINSNGKLNMIPNTTIFANVFKNKGFVINNEFQQNEYITIYPREYFSPKNSITGEINITSNTYAIHLFNSSWIPERIRKRDDLYKKLYKSYKEKYPLKIAHWLAKFVATLKVEGIKGLKNRALKKEFYDE